MAYYTQCTVTTPTTFDLIRRNLEFNGLHSSYFNLFYQLEKPRNLMFSREELETHRIRRSLASAVLPSFVLDKKEQMERKRDWSRWDSEVGATG